MNPTNQAALPFKFNPLWDAPRAVYAHYFPTFPISIDNRLPSQDYYNMQFLNPAGESGKWAANGGFLRVRPLPVAPMAGTPTKQAWCTENMKHDVAMAISRGLTGFCQDIMSVSDGLTGMLPWMLAAAAAVDPRFKIIPMFDMNGVTTATDAELLSILQLVAASPVAKRLKDGRMVFAAYNAPAKPLAGWQSVIAAANAAGLAVAFLPVLVGGPGDAGSLNPVAWGVGAWGTATPGASANLNPTKAHAAGLKFMSPIDPQQCRPKSNGYWEAGNFGAFVAAWGATIATDCDLVQYVTWNDLSETSQVYPWTDATFNQQIGNGIYDLMAYYATWFATGVAPDITQDVLYWCHRREPSNAAHPGQANGMTVNSSGAPAVDNVEVMAFLTDPGKILITLGGKTTGFDVPAGISSVKVPLVAGTPTFTLQRNGSNVFSSKGPAQIYDAKGLPSGLLDLSYLSGSLTAAGLTSYSLV